MSSWIPPKAPADPLAGLADTTAPDDPPMGSVKAIAELLWGSWPRRTRGRFR